jgi:hypothetical protein
VSFKTLKKKTRESESQAECFPFQQTQVVDLCLARGLYLNNRLLPFKIKTFTTVVTVRHLSIFMQLAARIAKTNKQTNAGTQYFFILLLLDSFWKSALRCPYLHVHATLMYYKLMDFD